MPGSIVAHPTMRFDGLNKIKWALAHMPILGAIVEKYGSLQPLAGLTIVTSVHLEAKTARLNLALAELGAQVFATGSNPLSTQDDVAAGLSTYDNVTVYAKHGLSENEYREMLVEALKSKPHIIIDDGGDLVKLLHSDDYRDLSVNLLGGCEETTTGINRLKAMIRKGELSFPMVDVNGADCKHLYDNRFGTGQSAWDGIMRTTNLLVAGKNVVICGFGDCGYGMAMRARGLGAARVIVTEVDPVKALSAKIQGYEVMTMEKAASIGDFFVTVTGCKDVITKEHFLLMKDGAVLANAGHFDVEINLQELAANAELPLERRPNIKGYRLKDGRIIDVLAEGRLVNLAAADGHPAEIMDMSFAIQALSAIMIAKGYRNGTWERSGRLISVPEEIDREVAELALAASNIQIDELTPEQREYLGLDI